MVDENKRELGAMNTIDPTTWTTFADHPVFQSVRFDKNWYDGDADVDLQMLREAAAAILSRYAQSVCELIVLDDCTMYVSFSIDGETFCSVYPAQSDDDTRCYFLDIEGCDTEIRVKRIGDLLDVLDRYRGV